MVGFIASVPWPGDTVAVIGRRMSGSFRFNTSNTTAIKRPVSVLPKAIGRPDESLPKVVAFSSSSVTDPLPAPSHTCTGSEYLSKLPLRPLKNPDRQGIAQVHYELPTIQLYPNTISLHCKQPPVVAPTSCRWIRHEPFLSRSQVKTRSYYSRNGYDECRGRTFRHILAYWGSIAGRDVGRKEPIMTCVVCEPCHDCKYTDCVTVCPVDCFYQDEHLLYIDLDTCIDRDACIKECPWPRIFRN